MGFDLSRTTRFRWGGVHGHGCSPPQELSVGNRRELSLNLTIPPSQASMEPIAKQTKASQIWARGQHK